MEINLTVILKSKTESLEELKTILIDLVQQSTQEEACIQYELHQSSEDKTVFVLHETWADAIGLAKHNEQTYLKAFFESTKVLLDEPVKLYKTDRLA